MAGGLTMRPPTLFKVLLLILLILLAAPLLGMFAMMAMGGAMMNDMDGMVNGMMDSRMYR